jgi:hypothetical protein
MVLQGNLGGGKPMGGDQGKFLEIPVGPDVVQMLVGVDDDIDVSEFYVKGHQLFLQRKKILVQPRIDQDIPTGPANQIGVAAPGFPS